MGAYFRFYERRVEKKLRAEATRGVLPPKSDFYLGTPRTGPEITDRRQMVPPLGLREYWYPALPERKVPRGKPLYWRMLGEELAFFRDKQGAVVAVSDVCPHRGASMSKGSCFYEGTISCPYHGATFDASGECKAFLPEGPDSKMPGALKIRTYPTRAVRGWVYIWMGASEPVPIEQDLPPECFDEEATQLHSTYTYWPMNWIIAIENNNDSHNAFYAHRNSLMSLTMRRMRSRTPNAPRTKLVGTDALVPLMKNQNHYKDPKTGLEPFHLDHPEVGGVWPLGHWRKWLWALFKPWNWLVYNRWRIRRSMVASEEWAGAGGSAWHLPCIVRVNFGLYTLSRFAVPVTEDLCRVVYFNHRARAKLRVVQWIQTAWFHVYFNWWLNYNFSGADNVVAAPCRYWTEEYLSATDAHLVMLRKLVTERSRDARVRKQAAAQAAGLAVEETLFKEADRHGMAVEKTLDAAAAIQETAPAGNPHLEWIGGSPAR